MLSSPLNERRRIALALTRPCFVENRLKKSATEKSRQRHVGVAENADTAVDQAL